jgi:hypothetical protein
MMHVYVTAVLAEIAQKIPLLGGYPLRPDLIRRRCCISIKQLHRFP